MSHRTLRLHGEEAECAFLWRAMQHRLIVSKPYGNTTYDFIVQARAPGRTSPARGARLWRVQVKSARVRRGNGFYNICTEGSGRRYRPADVDFFAVWAAPCDAWYIIPARFIGRDRCVSVFPEAPNTRSKYERFRDAWHLLR